MRLIFTALILLVTTTTYAQTLPKLIQNLSDENYAIWANWQNRQIVRRAETIVSPPQYNYADRIVSDSFSRGITQMSGHSRSRSRPGSRFTNRNRDTNFNRRNKTSVTTYQRRYINPDYSGPGSILFYNPYARLEGGLGSPDWSNLFVPCKEGTVTMQEALDHLVGPQNPEKVFKIMMEGYFE